MITGHRGMSGQENLLPCEDLTKLGDSTPNETRLVSVPISEPS